MNYDAFPFEKFGQYSGTVVKVSEADVPGTELELPQQVAKDKTLYRVSVALDREDVDAYGAPVKLKPGMTLSANIVLETRRLIEWIFDPVLALGKKL